MASTIGWNFGLRLRNFKTCPVGHVIRVAAMFRILTLGTVAVSFVLLQSPRANAVSEADLPRLQDSIIAPFFTRGASGEFRGVDGVPIRYWTFIQPAESEKGALVIVSGRTE